MTPNVLAILVAWALMFGQGGGATIDKDDKAADLPWTRCLQTGCYATLPMTDAMLARWRAQDGAGRLLFKSGSGQDTILPMSFRGLARALDALGKD